MSAPQTFGHIKHALLQSGVFIPEDLLGRSEIADALAQEPPRDWITFAFCQDFFVKTHLRAETSAPAQFGLRENSIVLQIESSLLGVDMVPQPKFLAESRRRRDPVSQNVDLDGNCLNLFLRIVKGSGLNVSAESCIGIIQSAFEEGVADLVQLNLDFYDADDRGFFKIAPLIQDIRKKFSTFIALRGFPPKNHRVIDSIYAAGVDLLNFPMEGFARDAAGETVSPQILESLEYAVGVFPQGAVSTELAFGPVADLKEKIDRIASKGIVPQVKLPREGQTAQAAADPVEAVAACLAASAQQHKLNLKWLYPTAEFVTPLDASFFTDDPKTAQLAVRPHYRTMIGRKASEGFTALRRKLRVKNISDSFESAGL